jgi:gas vesicle protein
MKAFLVGLGIGLGLGVLFAPMSGEETRSNIADRANDLANSARESLEQGRERVQRGVEAIRSASGLQSSTRPTGTESAGV